MRSDRRIVTLVSLALAIILVLAISPVRAADITLEKSEEWYGQGDTIVHSVFTADVDEDDVVEIVTAGQVYTGVQTGTWAQMKIWNWNSTTQTLTLETTEEWTLGGTETVALSVHAADIDDDDHVEIVTAGYGLLQNATLHCDLVIWEYGPGTGWFAAHEFSQYVSTIYNSAYSANIDTGDDYLEIAVAGVALGSPDEGVLYLMTWNGTHLSVKDSTDWESGDTNAMAVYAENVDSDNEMEIITAGYTHELNVQKAELRVWNYTNSNLNLEDDIAWSPEESAEALSVHAADLDDDSSDIEMMTCGNTVHSIDGVLGDLETFTHSGTVITRDRSATWQYSQGVDTECHSVYAGEVDGTSPIDMITVGKTTVSGTDNGQMKMWNYDLMGSNIDEEETEEWYTTDDTEAHSAFVGDVDEDIDVEILSGGQAFDRTRIQAQLRIWYLS